MGKKLLIGLAVVFGLCFCLFVAVVVFLSLAEETYRVEPTGPAPPFAEVRDNVRSMTEAEWGPYLSSMQGNQVVGWRGWIAGVDTTLMGHFEVAVDMDPPDDPFSTPDVFFYVPGEVAKALHEGQEITFSGLVEDAFEFMGSVSVRLQDVTIE